MLNITIKKNTLKMIFLVFSILWMSTIFYFSSQSSISSLDASGELLVKMNKIEKEEIQNISDRKIWNLHYYIRKSAHFIMYSGLGFLILLHLVLKNQASISTCILAWLFASLYGIFDELHQTFIPGRGATMADVKLDSMSAFIGVIVGVVFYTFIIKKIIKE